MCVAMYGDVPGLGLRLKPSKALFSPTFLSLLHVGRDDSCVGSAVLLVLRRHQRLPEDTLPHSCFTVWWNSTVSVRMLGSKDYCTHNEN